MSFRDTKFNHDQDDFHLALGISTEVKTICRERIFFTSFSNALQAEELFEDLEEAPKSMSTVTGDLERLLKMIHNPLEYDYTLMIFQMYQRIAKESYITYKNLNENTAESREEKLKMQLLKTIMKLKDLKDREEHGHSFDDDEESSIEIISKDSMIERIKLVKKSGYNFDKYLVSFKSMMNNSKDQSKDNFDISDLLSGLFSDDDE